MTHDELFDGWERAWSGRDPAAFAPLCDVDVHYEDPLTAEPLIGAEAISVHAQRLWQAFPDARLQSTGPRLTDGRFASSPCKLLGTDPANHFLIVHAVVYAELRDGRLLRARTFFDLYDAAVQMSILPRSGTLGEKALLFVRGFGIRGTTRP